MARAQQRAGDPNAGRLAVIAAGVLGLGALAGYAYVQSRERSEAQATAQRQAPVEPTAQAPTIPELVDRAAQARADLDTATLGHLAGELATAAHATTTTPKALDAQHERLAVLGALAVEAAVRAGLGDTGARKQLGEHVAAGHRLVDELEDELDPGAVMAARARLALAGGEDVTLREPAVLLPTFRDRELQHVLLAEPLWHPGPERPIDEAARAELARELDALPDPSALERLVLAMALDADQGARAQSLVREVLATVPGQPLAEGLLARLRGEAQVAVADPLPVETSAGTPEVEPEPVEVEPEPVEVEPEPVEIEPVEIEPEPELEPAKPEPTKPKPEPTKPKPEPTKPKPEPTKPKPKPTKEPGDLADEGCKLVHGGKAEQGFALLQKAFDLDPRDTKVTLCMAEGHMKLGRLPSARAMVERVLRSSGKNKKALLLAAKIEDKLGNKRAAADYYRKLLELEPDNATAQAYVDQHG